MNIKKHVNLFKFVTVFLILVIVPCCFFWENKGYEVSRQKEDKKLDYDSIFYVAEDRDAKDDTWDNYYISNNTGFSRLFAVKNWKSSVNPKLVSNNGIVCIIYSGYKNEYSCELYGTKDDETSTKTPKSDLIIKPYGDDLDLTTIVYKYSNNTLHKEKSISKRGDRVLDAFIKEGKVVYVREVDNTSGFLKKLLIPRADTTGIIDNKNVSHSIVGDSALAIKGVLVNDEYYYPTLSGIYKYSTKTGKEDKVREENNKLCKNVELYYNKGHFMCVYEKFPLIEHEGVFEYSNKITNNIHICIYNKNWEKVKSLNLKGNIVRTINNEKRLLVYTYKNSYVKRNNESVDTRLNVNVFSLDKNTLKTRNYYKNTIMLNGGEYYYSDTVDRTIDDYFPIYYYDNIKKDFVKYDR